MYDGPEIEHGQRVIVQRDGKRMSELQLAHHREIHVEKLRQEATLDHIPRICGAALFRVLEPFPQVRRERVPVGEIPDTPRVQTLLLEDVSPVRIRESDRGLAPIRPAPDEGEGPDLRRLDERVAEIGADAGDECYGKPGASHQGVSEGERMKTALRRRLRDHGVPGEYLHQFGVHLHAHRVVPRGDV